MTGHRANVAPTTTPTPPAAPVPAASKLRAAATLLVAAAILASAAPGLAQDAPPGTDIFVVDVALRDGRLAVGAVRNITARPGYDNQPFFSPDGRSVYFSSIRNGDQPDIYRYDLDSGTTVQVTRTPEGEYSPTPLPDGGISVVRVEADGTQRLWRFSADGTNPTLVLPGIAPVGYHAWGDDNTLALFVLGDPHMLQIADVRTGEAATLAHDIGRSLHRIPGQRAISFVHREDGKAWIKRLDLATREAQVIIPVVGNAEDYAWLPDGSLLMGQGSKLYRFDPASDSDWRELADLAAHGIDGITRIAVSPDGARIAVVAAGPGR